MSTDENDSPEDAAKRKIDEFAARGEARRAELARAKLVQRAIDLEAIEEIKIKHGEDFVSVIELVAWKQGLPTLIAVRKPSKDEGKRFNQQVMAGEKTDAIELIGDACRVYPDGTAYKALRDVFPGLHYSVANRAMRLNQAGVEEGKGG